MQGVLDDVAEAVRPYVGGGVVADYIPGLASVPADRFGMALAMNDGELYGVGDWERPFSIQSISKVFTLTLALGMVGASRRAATLLYRWSECTGNRHVYASRTRFIPASCCSTSNAGLDLL